jgi:hypothetical protein
MDMISAHEVTSWFLSNTSTGSIDLTILTLDGSCLVCFSLQASYVGSNNDLRICNVFLGDWASASDVSDQVLGAWEAYDLSLR